MKNRLYIVCLLVLLVGGLLPYPAALAQGANPRECVTSYDASVDYFPEKTTVQYAEGLEITYFNHYKLVRVTNPWRGATSAFEYVLVQCGTPRPTDDRYRDALFIEVPIQSLISLSSTQLPPLVALGVQETLIGVDSAAYISTPEIVRMAEAGKLVEIGNGAQVDVDRALLAGPDLVMTNGIGIPEWDAHPKLLEAGIPVALNGDYMETEPLGSAEWIKFVAAFYNREAEAEAVFNAIVEEYNRLVALTGDVAERPTVLINAPFGDSWNVSGGNSYMAKLLADAGAEYLWADDTSTGSIPLDFESVFARAANADFWINPGIWASLADGLAADERFAEFAAFKNGKVFNNNARVNPNGGNDYFENGAAKPHLVLADLIKIFHPALLPDHNLYFYQQLK